MGLDYIALSDCQITCTFVPRLSMLPILIVDYLQSLANDNLQFQVMRFKIVLFMNLYSQNDKVDTQSLCIKHVLIRDRSTDNFVKKNNRFQFISSRSESSKSAFFVFFCHCVFFFSELFLQFLQIMMKYCFFLLS